MPIDHCFSVQPNLGQDHAMTTKRIAEAGTSALPLKAELWAISTRIELFTARVKKRPQRDCLLDAVSSSGQAEVG
jgi:hypothetical protein